MSFTGAGSRTSFSKNPAFALMAGSSDVSPGGPPHREAISKAFTAVFSFSQA